MTTDTLPTLTGTDKQISWANDIRAKAIASIDTLMAEQAKRIAERNIPAAQAQPVLDRNANAIAAVLAHTDARYWIDRSGWRAQDLIREVVS